MTTIARGFDYLTTIRADQHLMIPDKMLGPGMESFAETVSFVGAPLVPPFGNADTIMERLEEGVIGEPVKTRLVAFANVSGVPIKLGGMGKLAGYYDLYVTLSPSAESHGSAVYYQDSDSGGSFQSTVDFCPLFEFRPLGSGESLVVDTGRIPIPGFPMKLGTVSGRWSIHALSAFAVRHFRGKSFFYDGAVVITAKRDPRIHKEAPAIPGFGPETIAACVKVQAEFTTNTEVGQFGRRNFMRTMSFANMELPK